MRGSTPAVTDGAPVGATASSSGGRTADPVDTVEGEEGALSPSSPLDAGAAGAASSSIAARGGGGGCDSGAAVGKRGKRAAEDKDQGAGEDGGDADGYGDDVRGRDDTGEDCSDGSGSGGWC